MIEGLLEYTRLESSGVHPRAEPVDLVALAREVAQASAEDRPDMSPGVPVQVETAEPSLPALKLDRRLLTVVLANLIGNAVKFTPQGRVIVRVMQRDGAAILEVEDTGIGIPPDALERIFLPFEQLEPLQRKSTPGVGLGLALVRQIVEALHGRVQVVSQPGVGSTFRVILPITEVTSSPT